MIQAYTASTPDFEILGPNFRTVTMHNPRTAQVLKIWWSYRTVVGFAHSGKRFVRENEWGPTTGRHINEIASVGGLTKADRIPGERFDIMLAEAIVNHYEGK